MTLAIIDAQAPREPTAGVAYVGFLTRAIAFGLDAAPAAADCTTASRARS
jgi:hypothetical protein